MYQTWILVVYNVWLLCSTTILYWYSHFFCLNRILGILRFGYCISLYKNAFIHEPGHVMMSKIQLKALESKLVWQTFVSPPLAVTNAVEVSMSVGGIPVHPHAKMFVLLVDRFLFSTWVLSLNAKFCFVFIWGIHFCNFSWSILRISCLLAAAPLLVVPSLPGPFGFIDLKSITRASAQESYTIPLAALILKSIWWSSLERAFMWKTFIITHDVLSHAKSEIVHKCEHTFSDALMHFTQFLWLIHTDY